MVKLYLNNVTKTYNNGFKALSDITLTINNHDFIVIVGPSGCGKTTLLRIIAGLETISKGQLLFNSKVMNDIPASKRQVGMVFQEFGLFPHMSVKDNIAFALKNKKDKDRKINEISQVLDIKDLLERYPNTLSGGQKQRVSMARAIISMPELLLLDEPLSHLDQSLKESMKNEIRHLYHKYNKTYIYVTHDQNEAMTLATHICVMNKGKILQYGQPKDIYDYPECLFVAKFIGNPQMNILEGTVIEKEHQTYISIEDNIIQYSDLNHYIGQDIYIGIRPEDFILGTAYRFKIERYDYIGDMYFIYGQCLGNNICIKSSEIFNTDIIYLDIRTDYIHIFDKKSEERINKRGIIWKD